MLDSPQDLIDVVAQGADIFDCVAPPVAPPPPHQKRCPGHVTALFITVTVCLKTTGGGICEQI
ncbi:queuine tRNA-ribosyltransferase family protein [Coxiella-like endosymbiont of Rhipicephalus sanguineus]|uniref:queuine tRNA-ribosyltransferase family protein n=1 Tax=Coxiella-like endosymbiont of Rhipicephalus sanguineus TaxID=1955402 RepID=UPI00203FE88B|nr:queuine tRNA-ribosyltransferase family protein [Coxiella-like endosymbiont of Rhipicephalus sanguineus]